MQPHLLLKLLHWLLIASMLLQAPMHVGVMAAMPPATPIAPPASLADHLSINLTVL